MDIKQLKETVDTMFTKRGQLMLLWQELAENFYPERADFTLRREIGDEFAGWLSSSYPVLVRRDLGDQIGSMLRPSGKEWFHIVPEDEGRNDNDARRWLEAAALHQRRQMYKQPAQFTRATKEGDHDFAAFGQTCISVTPNRSFSGLLYRCWHLRDMAWNENENGGYGIIARKWSPFARDIKRLFKQVHLTTLQKAEREPFSNVDCYHIIVEADLYEGDQDAGDKPYWSIYYDCESNHVMEATPVYNQEYCIPRWQTVSGSQYAYSPASITGIADARLIQAMTYTLLEAGEKATNPPLVATQDAVRSDMALYAGGVTWVDLDYDERLGDALRPLNQDLRGLPFGAEMLDRAAEIISQCFFLNKLSLPPQEVEMTAFETGQRVQEYIRGAIPIFEPMETDYNGRLCEMTFDLMLRSGAFGSPRDMPPSLLGADVQFQFESPLHDAIEQQKGQKFLEAKELLAQAIDIDQSALALLDAPTALRDALKGVGVPAEWVRNKDDVDTMVKQEQEAAAQQQMLERIHQSSEVAVNLSKAQVEGDQVAEAV